jgi:hypothetical protein
VMLLEILLSMSKLGHGLLFDINRTKL